MKLSKNFPIWTLIGLYILVIYTTLPVMRYILNWLYKTAGNEGLVISVNTVLLGIAVVVLFMFFKKGVLFGVSILIPMLITGVFIHLLERPEERVHFLEYGLLGVLFFKGFLQKVKGNRISTTLFIKSFLLSWVAVTVVGAGDELIQYVLPNRVGDIRDIAMNAAGGGLGVWVASLWYYTSRNNR